MQARSDAAEAAVKEAVKEAKAREAAAKAAAVAAMASAPMRLDIKESLDGLGLELRCDINYVNQGSPFSCHTEHPVWSIAEGAARTRKWQFFMTEWEGKPDQGGVGQEWFSNINTSGPKFNLRAKDWLTAVQEDHVVLRQLGKLLGSEPASAEVACRQKGLAQLQVALGEVAW